MPMLEKMALTRESGHVKIGIRRKRQITRFLKNRHELFFFLCSFADSADFENGFSVQRRPGISFYERLFAAASL